MSAPYDDDDSAGLTAVLTPELPSVRSARARTWTTAVMGTVIFVAGIVCGATAFRPEPKPLRNWNDLLERVAKRMAPDLELTEEQQKQIEQILRAHQPRLNQIHAHTIAEMRTELQEVIKETSAVLTPEQDVRFRAKAQRDLNLHFPAAEQASSAGEGSPGGAPAKEAPPHQPQSQQAQ